MSSTDINISETLRSVETLLRQDKSVSPQVRAMMDLLVVVIKLLVGKLRVNSRNSSKPPSADPNRKRGSRRLRSGKKRKPGGQPGHNGSNLKPVKNPDRIEILDVDRRTVPSGNYKQIGYESRQVIDIEISRLVTEFRAEILEDSEKNQYVAKFPKGVKRPVQYGNSLKAQSVYMSQQQLIPYDRVQDYFSDQCGIPISTGSLVNFNKQAFRLLDKFEEITRRNLIHANVLNADETGVNVNGKLRWLHSNSNDQWTLFFPHKKRGLPAMQAMGVLEHFKGILIHDHWKAYFRFKCQHALCNAHHLRELEWVWENEHQNWAKKMQTLLLKTDDAVKNNGGSLNVQKAQKFRKLYRNILKKGSRECPPPKKSDKKPKRGRIKRSKARNLLERLLAFETEVLRFMTDKNVPFTNNQGENDIRMTKVQQKISGCFRSHGGAEHFCRIRGYLSTCRKHGIKPTEALKLLFAGKLPTFATAA